REPGSTLTRGAVARSWNRPSLSYQRIAKGAGARRGDRVGMPDCRRTVRGRLADRAEVDATTGGNRHRRGDGGRLARDQRRLAVSGAAGHFARHLLRGVDRHRGRRNLPGGGVVLRRPQQLRALARRQPHHRRRDHAQARALALLWQILSGTGFPNQFFCDSWVVGFWRGRPWLAGRRIGKKSLDAFLSRFWIGWVTRRGDKCVRSTCRG